MKIRKIALSIALTAALAVAPALVGCSGDHYSSTKFDAQDTSYIVTSQGGNAVGYGNYIYFINGTRGYDDEDGKDNVWGEVVKGALYRAELNGSKVGGDAYSTFRPTLDKDAGLEFKYTADTDYFDEPVNVVNVTEVAPKTVGTSGYKGGGIFIYDNYVYFASPRNLKNATGTVETTRTDFFMMPLSGGKPTLVYTTSEGVDTTSAEYAFYKYGSKVYLVVNEVKDDEGTIYSVRINPDKAKVEETVYFDVKATGVYFPVRDTYYTGIDCNTPEDFIYFVRNTTDSEPKPAGTVIEGMRPDGSEPFIFRKSGQTETIEAVRDGVLFYRTSVSGKSVMAYSSLHEVLMENSATYAAAQNKLSEKDKNKQFDGVFPMEITSSITSTYAYRPDVLSDQVYYVAGDGSNISRYELDGTVTTMCSDNGTLLFAAENYLYCAGANSDYYRIPLFENMDGWGTIDQLATDTSTATFPADYVSGYFTYFAEVDQWADDYMFFRKVDGIQGLDPHFVGKRAEADIPTEEELEEAKGLTESD